MASATETARADGAAGDVRERGVRERRKKEKGRLGRAFGGPFREGRREGKERKELGFGPTLVFFPVFAIFLFSRI